MIIDNACVRTTSSATLTVGSPCTLASSMINLCPVTSGSWRRHSRSSTSRQDSPTIAEKPGLSPTCSASRTRSVSLLGRRIIALAGCSAQRSGATILYHPTSTSGCARARPSGRQLPVIRSAIGRDDAALCGRRHHDLGRAGTWNFDHEPRVEWEAGREIYIERWPARLIRIHLSGLEGPPFDGVMTLRRRASQCA